MTTAPQLKTILVLLHFSKISRIRALCRIEKDFKQWLFHPTVVFICLFLFNLLRAVLPFISFFFCFIFSNGPNFFFILFSSYENANAIIITCKYLLIYSFFSLSRLLMFINDGGGEEGKRKSFFSGAKARPRMINKSAKLP